MKTHVLIIDPYKNDLRFFMDALDQCLADFKCTYAASPVQAIEMLKYLAPDYVFVVSDPLRQKALELVSAIRCDERLEATRVVICSNQLTGEAKKMASILGAAGCIEKQGSTSFLQQLWHLFADETVHVKSAAL